ncbi:MAG: site-specific integrase [Deltaproteobacteria bacterium]|nr:site-specific integrase [Deltaproteobacteria bacterium]
MFETLFSYPAVLHRHRDGPFAPERAEYLQRLSAMGMARGTVLRHARYCLCVAVELQGRPRDHCFTEEEVEAIAAGWAAGRVRQGRASGTRWPAEQFRSVAREFLFAIDRLRSSAPSAPSSYNAKLSEFVAAQQGGRWHSAATCQSATWQVRKFLGYLDQRGLALEHVTATDIDAYLRHMAPRWSRTSLHTSAKFLRAWFAYGEVRGWVQRGLASAIQTLVSPFQC